MHVRRNNLKKKLSSSYRSCSIVHVPIAMLWAFTTLFFIQRTNSFIIGGGLIQPFRITTCSESKILLPSQSTIRSRGSSYNKCNEWKLYSTKEGSPPPLPNTEDPFLILGLSTPTADVKVIKRAYRRMALKYHPDVRINSNSTEGEKKIANDDFAKINAAYAMLTGKGDNGSTSASSGRGASANSSSSSNQRGKYSYTPPHRRTGQSTKSSYDWEDFMPKNDGEQYDTNGDSFGAIFSDLFSELGKSAAGGKGGGASILNDFVSFLEGNFPSVGNTQQNEEDLILNALLKGGSFEEIKNELDDAKLLVKQLEGKQKDLMMELEDLSKESTNVNQSATYMDQMRLEERRREVEARKEIVEEYLDRAKVRQIKLKRRYEEMRIDEEFKSNKYERSTEAEPQRDSSASDEEDAWKRESFGSGGRSRARRSRSRPSSSQRSASSSPSSSPSSSSSSSTYSSSKTSSNSGFSASSSYGSRSSSSSKKSWTSNKTGSSSSATSNRTSSTRKGSLNTNESILPPHRRITSRLEKDLEDKRRLREIKVDEEIDKMKKELGL